ncbi:MAG: Mut7-C RNAse domain-containing protein [Calditrichaceae bacterium]
MNKEITHKSVDLRFYAELNDFLPADKQFIRFNQRFKGTPSVKDLIEAAGVPHPEIDLILVNSESVNFAYKISDHDQISVYPEFELLNITPIIRLRARPLRITKFILDINLGKLAKYLRILGFDTYYNNKLDDSEIVSLAGLEHRIILTKDIGLLKYKAVTHGFWIRSVYVREQLREVVEKLDIGQQAKPFTRCAHCNGELEIVPKEVVRDRLEPRTKKYFSEFRQCPDCEKIYWKGSHFKRMQKIFDDLIEITATKKNPHLDPDFYWD